MRYSLLDLTKSILRSMESDEVSSIDETQEAMDVVDIIKECYFDIIGQMDLTEHRGVFKLDASTDNLKPTLMTIPENVARVEWLKYNIGPSDKPDYKLLRYVSNEEFLAYQTGKDPNDVNTMTVMVNGITLPFKYGYDRYPSYYTIFDEKFAIFDSFDQVEESTLTQARSLGYGIVIPVFELDNDFIPDLDPRQFQLLLQDAKSTAHIELKQAPNPKAEQKYRKNQILAQRNRDDNDPRASRQRTYRFGRCR